MLLRMIAVSGEKSLFRFAATQQSSLNSPARGDKPMTIGYVRAGMGSFPSTSKEKQTYSLLPSLADIQGSTKDSPFGALWLLKQQRG
ncbi:MAG: hypothetical protein KGI75_03555 [Rhizobiaceae bacterium]|nr:hypothetical protein [Rhizobiaceae bacterium]